jgi:16S rRNA (guanine966-N2)-methyltransferase
MRIIAGSHRGRKLHSPTTDATRPILDQQKEALFNILRDCFPCCGALDVFSGSGSLGLEALSRGAERATLVERGSQALTALRKNIDELGFKERANLLKCDALRLEPERLAHAYSVAFLDPPFPLVLAEAEKVAALLERVLAQRSEDEEGCVVLRVPSSFATALKQPWSGDCFDKRQWGESLVLFIR